MLARLAADASLPDGVSVVLIHAVNPFGFARLRRTNEGNVDLNRNFLNATQSYEGAPAGYAALDPLLHPTSPPARLEPFRMKALWYIQRLGMPALKAAVAGGQYQFPQGLFFGGHRESTSTRLVRRHLRHWLGGAEHIVHIDLHSGLGAFARHRLLLLDPVDSPQVPWYRKTFDPNTVEPAADSVATAYDAGGTLGGWAAASLGSNSVQYRFVTAEFGTYPIVRVLGALRAENRVHHFGQSGTPAFERAKTELLECFCPRSEQWRTAVIGQGVGIVERAMSRARHA